MKKYTDTELIDYLEQQGKQGACPGLINDDGGRWAVSEEGTQNCPSKQCSDIWTLFSVKKNEWKKTVRGALTAYIEEGKK